MVEDLTKILEAETLTYLLDMGVKAEDLNGTAFDDFSISTGDQYLTLTNGLGYDKTTVFIPNSGDMLEEVIEALKVLGVYSPNVESEEWEQDMKKEVDSIINKVSGGSTKKKKKKMGFYDTIRGTSHDSRYVVIAKSKENSELVAIRYAGTSFSIRITGLPVSGEKIEFDFGVSCTVLDLKTSSQGHISAHLQVAEGMPLVRLLTLIKAELGKYFTFVNSAEGYVGIDLDKVKELGI